MATLNPIAIVGIHAELPSGSYSPHNLDYDSFIRFLLDKGEAYERIPAERFNVDLWRGRGLGKVLPELGVFLKDSTAFDPLEFGITLKDARAMSVSTRKLVEASFLALLDSGIQYRGRNVGCYVSGTAFDINSVADPDEFEARGSFAGIPCMLANRVSYHLDLLGPSLQTDTACSSTLTALHLAIQGIRNHDCESAVVAGCQLNHRLIDFIQYSQGSLVSIDGKCKPFDIAANGFSRGEGVVAIVLKPFADAIRDGDRMYASILGTGINNTGGAAPVGAPVAAGQIQAMLKAFNGTGRTAAEVNYVELHATGTAAGDPVEANWVGEYFKRDHPILIGSVKANIGHLEITAFLASLCKVCGMFQTGIIPPAVNLTTLNPAIKWDEFGLSVPAIATPLPSNHNRGLPLVSLLSSGIGGSNGHCVVEAPPRQASAVSDPRQKRIGPALLVAAGLSPRSARMVGDHLAQCAAESMDLNVLSTLYGRRGRQMTWRSFTVASPASIVPIEFKTSTLVSQMNPPLVFVFTGQGPQHLEMGRQLFQNYASFRNSILTMDDIYRAVIGVSLVETTGLFGSSSNDVLQDLWPIAITLPAIAMIQMALVDLLVSVGVVADAVIGHSAGETAMMYASGFCSREMALELAIARGQAMSLAESAGGTMAALACGPAQAAQLITATCDNDLPNQLEIACFNSPNAVTVAGPCIQIEQLVALAQDQDIFARKLRTRTPVHSSLMETCHQLYQDSIEAVFAAYPKAASATPHVKVYSTLTGRRWTSSFSPDYFWQTTRRPVLFTHAVTSLLQDIPSPIFVEISAHPALTSYLTTLAPPSSSVVCPMERQKKPTSDHEVTVFLQCIGHLILLGYNNIDFGRLNQVDPSIMNQSTIPNYPFAKKDIPYHPPSSAMISRQKSTNHGPLNRPNLKIGALTHPALAQHVISGEGIMPATGYLEMVFEHGARILRNITFKSMMPLSPDKLLRVRLESDHDSVHWRIISSFDPPSSGPGTSLTKHVHAEGSMFPSACQPIPASNMDIPSIKNRLREVDVSGFYGALDYFAQYGPLYRRVTAFHLAGDEALVRITGMEPRLQDSDNFTGYVTNPIIMDACCHALVHPAMTGNADRNIYYLPDSIGTVSLFAEDLGEQDELYAHIEFRQWSPEALWFNVSILDESGRCMCEMVDFRVARHELSIPVMPTVSYDLVYQPLGLWYNQASDMIDIVNAHEVRQISDVQVALAIDLDYANLIHWVRSALSSVVECIQKRMISVLCISDDSSWLSALFFSFLETHSNVVLELVESPEAKRKSEASPSLIVHPFTATENYKPAGKTFDIIILQSTIQPVDPALLPLLRALACPGTLFVAPSHRCRLPCEIASDLTIALWKDVLEQHGFTTALFAVDLRCPNSSGIQAVKQITSPTSSAFLAPSTPTIVTFLLGGELATLRSQLLSANSRPIWVAATSSIDSAAARGFVRSLQRELPGAQLRLVAFDDRWKPAEQELIIQHIAERFSQSSDHEFFVDLDGILKVPRLVPCLLEHSRRDPDWDAYWIFERDILHFRSLPTIPVDWVLIDVRNTSTPYENGLRAICGTVNHTAVHGWKPSASVVAITDQAPSNRVLVHHSYIASAPPNIANLLQFVVPITVLAYTIGISSLLNRERLETYNVLLLEDESIFVRVLKGTLEVLGCTVHTLSASAPLEDICLAGSRSNIIFSGAMSVSRKQVVQCAVPTDHRVIFWHDMTQQLRLIPGATERWLFSDAVRDILPRLSDDLASRIPSALFPNEGVPTSKIQRDLGFDSSKAYLLVGGIGSLGLRLALWMYQKGARYIILTSRTGEATLRRSNDVLALRILTYLQKQPDSRVVLAICDSTNLPEMLKLKDTIDYPLAGCFLLAAVLDDRLFELHTEESYYRPFPSKIESFRVLEQVLTIPDLDFLIAISSIATFGNPGQTNYASANSVLDELTRLYPNAFSMIAPAILDTSMIVRGTSLASDPRLSHLTSWGLSSQALFNCIEDGISKLSQGPFWLYVPALKWSDMSAKMGSSALYDHLCPPANTTSVESGEETSTSLHELVLKFLDVSPHDFVPEVPFTSYGLDSLSAGRLSLALQPWLHVTQLQLLGHMNFVDLQSRLHSKDVAPPEYSRKPFTWARLNQPGENVVVLVDGVGVPLILIHGFSGNIVAFMQFQERFSTPLWAIQTTPETPLDSVGSTAQHYVSQIKLARPHGPYRIGGFSASSLLTFEVVRLLEAEHDVVVQLAMLDHFPTLFTSPSFELDDISLATGQPSPHVIESVVHSICGCYMRDQSAARHGIAHELQLALQDLPVREYISDYMSIVRLMTAGVTRFLVDIAGPSPTRQSVRIALVERLKSIKAPVTIYVASQGMRPSIPESQAHGWEDLGCSESFPHARVIAFDSSHFDLFEKDVVVQSLETDWLAQ